MPWPHIDTPEDYEAFKHAFALGTGGYTSYSPACSEDCEGDFSWRSCEVCDRALGGARHRLAAIKDDEVVELAVCVDCLYYAEYGRLDDETMSRVAR